MRPQASRHYYLIEFDNGPSQTLWATWTGIAWRVGAKAKAEEEAEEEEEEEEEMSNKMIWKSTIVGTDFYPLRILLGVVLDLKGCQTPAQYWIRILHPWVQEFCPAPAPGVFPDSSFVLDRFQSAKIVHGQEWGKDGRKRRKIEGFGLVFLFLAPSLGQLVSIFGWGQFSIVACKPFVHCLSPAQFLFNTKPPYLQPQASIVSVTTQTKVCKPPPPRAEILCSCCGDHNAWSLLLRGWVGKFLRSRAPLSLCFLETSGTLSAQPWSQSTPWSKAI